MFLHKSIPLYHISEAAELLGASEETISDLIQEKKIETRNLFKTEYITETGLDELADTFQKTRITHPERPRYYATDIIEYEGRRYYSPRYASFNCEYSIYSIRQYLRHWKLSGRKIAGNWYLSEAGMDDICNRVLQQTRPKGESKQQPVTQTQSPKTVVFESGPAMQIIDEIKPLSRLLKLNYTDTMLKLLSIALSNKEDIETLLRTTDAANSRQRADILRQSISATR